jgi:hypothetical protein
MPDPILRHLDVARIPSSWSTLPARERSVRGRYALVAICAGIQGDLAWRYALDTSRAATTEIERAIEGLPDDVLERMVSDSAAAKRAPAPTARVKC